MYHLQKKLPHETHYWEVWKSGKRLHFSYGVLGISNKEEEQQLGFFENGKKLMKRLVEEKENEGYVLCNEDQEIKIDISYHGEASEFENFRQASYKLQDTINDHLMTTGVGSTEGIRVNERDVAIYFNVVDVDLGMKIIQKVLLERELLNDSRISLLQEDGTYLGANI